MRIGIDIDGVLFPFTDAANAAVMAKFGVPDPGPHVRWNHLKEQITREQWSWLWSPQGQYAVFSQLHRTYPGVVPAFDAILASGHECHFVAHREPALAGEETTAFLARHFGRRRWEGLHLLRNTTPKHPLAEWDVFIDDKPETVMDLLLMTRAKVFAPVRPWNGELLPHVSRRFTYYTEPRVVAEWVLAQ